MKKIPLVPESPGTRGKFFKGGIFSWKSVDRFVLNLTLTKTQYIFETVMSFLTDNEWVRWRQRSNKHKIIEAS